MQGDMKQGDIKHINNTHSTTTQQYISHQHDQSQTVSITTIIVNNPNIFHRVMHRAETCFRSMCNIFINIYNNIFHRTKTLTDAREQLAFDITIRQVKDRIQKSNRLDKPIVIAACKLNYKYQLKHTKCEVHSYPFIDPILTNRDRIVIKESIIYAQSDESLKQISNILKILKVSFVAINYIDGKKLISRTTGAPINKRYAEEELKEMRFNLKNEITEHIRKVEKSTKTERIIYLHNIRPVYEILTDLCRVTGRNIHPEEQEIINAFGLLFQ